MKPLLTHNAVRTLSLMECSALMEKLSVALKRSAEVESEYDRYIASADVQVLSNKLTKCVKQIAWSDQDEYAKKRAAEEANVLPLKASM